MPRAHTMPTDSDLFGENLWQDDVACMPTCPREPLCTAPFCWEPPGIWQTDEDACLPDEWDESDRWDAVDEWLADVEDDPEAGATTAEYAVLTLAAVAFAGVLAVVVRSGPVQALLQGIIERALTQ